MAQRVTIQDIADALGLSRNTVSKALNNTPGIAEATRYHIIQKASEMGYKQFAYANALLSMGEGAHPGVGLLGHPEKREVALFSTAYLSAPHFSSLMLDSIQNELSQLGLTLNTHRISEANLADLSLPITFVPERVAAIICIEMFDFAYDEMLCELDTPVLFVDGPAAVDGRVLSADMLLMENTTQIMRLVNETLETGRKRIGFIGNWKHCQSFFERYMAFRSAMLLAGESVPEELCICYNHSEEIGQHLAQLEEMPDLFICANDFVALDVMRACHNLDIDVPLELALAGFDDSAESRRSLPQLTTVHIHTQSMAYSALHLLKTRLEEPRLYYRREYVETNLIYRESTPWAE